MRKLTAHTALASSALALGLFALQAIQPASARSAREEISPAEEQVFPYDAQIPACQDASVLEEISSLFAEKEAKYWNTSITIASYDTITRTAWRPYGVDFIPRRYCSAVATTSDGVRRKIDYSVRESTGFIGATWGVDYCVHGLDRNLAYNLFHRLPDGAALMLRGLALAILLLAATVAQAQDYGGFRGRGGGGDRGGTPGSFDFYVLSLSWSPSYCSGQGGARDADGQCSPGRGLGFVVHGLWPQYSRGFPSNCGAFPRALTGDAMAAAGEIMPSAGLARHEWKTHGTCSGLDPLAYFKAVKTARQAVTIPEPYRKPGAGQRAAPLEIARQFTEANRGLRTDMMTVTCKRGQLEEVRICFDKDLKGFTSCPTVARQGCRGGDVEIDAAR